MASYLKSIAIAYFVTLPVPSNALSPHQKGDVVNGQELRLDAGRWHVVPQCKNWMLQDVRKYASESWVEVDGSLQLMDDYRDINGRSYFMRGSFTFTASEHNEHLSWVLKSGSRFKVHAVIEDSKIDIYEFGYWGLQPGCDGK